MRERDAKGDVDSRKYITDISKCSVELRGLILLVDTLLRQL